MPAENARLFYLVGPSGAGKDSAAPGLRVARRCITRPQHPGDEDHVELSATEFARRERAGEFLFAWRSHGFSYGIERTVLDWLRAGDDVVVNGSRAYLETALAVYPQLAPVWITVDESVLRERLGARGRETAAQIEARIRRNREHDEAYRSCYACIHNDGPITDALAEFEALRRTRR
jgi:ribose 1,5-bisphosphokinase